VAPVHFIKGAKWLPELLAFCGTDGWVFRSVDMEKAALSLLDNPGGKSAPAIEDESVTKFKEANPTVTTILVIGESGKPTRRGSHFEHEDGWMYADGRDGGKPMIAPALHFSAENKRPLHFFSLDLLTRNLVGKVAMGVPGYLEKLNLLGGVPSSKHEPNASFKALDIAELAHSQRLFPQTHTVLALGGHGSEKGFRLLRPTLLDYKRLSTLVVNLMKDVVGGGRLLVVVEMCYAFDLVAQAKRYLQEQLEAETYGRVSFWYSTCTEGKKSDAAIGASAALLKREAVIKVNLSNFEGADNINQMKCGPGGESKFSLQIPSLKAAVNTIGKGYTDCTNDCSQVGKCTMGSSTSKDTALRTWKLEPRELKLVVDLPRELKHSLKTLSISNLLDSVEKSPLMTTEPVKYLTMASSSKNPAFKLDQDPGKDLLQDHLDYTLTLTFDLAKYCNDHLEQCEPQCPLAALEENPKVFVMEQGQKSLRDHVATVLADGEVAGQDPGTELGDRQSILCGETLLVKKGLALKDTNLNGSDLTVKCHSDGTWDTPKRV